MLSLVGEFGQVHVKPENPGREVIQMIATE